MDNNAGSCEFPRVELWYGSILVGHVARVFCTDDTWFGFFEAEPEEKVQGNATLGRLYEYIKFSEDWNDRHYRNPGDPPDASEFDSFSDVTHSFKWYARTPRGDDLLIFRAPVFLPDGGVSWRPR